MDWQFKVALVMTWAVSTALISGRYYVHVKKPKGESVAVADFLVIAGCVAGAISSLNLIRLIFFSDETSEFIRSLDVGDIITLVL